MRACCGGAGVNCKIGSLKYALNGVYSGGTPTAGDDSLYDDGGTPFVTIGDMSSQTPIISTKRHLSEGGCQSKNLKTVQKGTILLSMYATIGLPNILGIDACISQAIIALFSRRDQNPRFLYWWLMHYRGFLEAEVAGSTQGNLNAERVKNIRFRFIDIATQRQIADFMDRETARIDLLIEKKQRLVALLGEKEAAFIESIVTKGFTFQPSRNQKVRDDGWLLAKLKNLSSRLKVGVVVNPSEYVDDSGDIPFIYGGNIREYTIDVANCRRMSAESSRRLSASRLRPGDVVVVRVGAPGVAAVIPGAIAEANCASIMCVTPKACSGEWLAYAFNTRFVRHQVEVVQYGAAQKQFNLEHAREFTMPVPPCSEEPDLIERIRAFRDRNSKIKDSTLQSIDRLKEYRSALITAAVTGQIDVQTHARSGTTDRRLDAIEEEMGA